MRRRTMAATLVSVVICIGAACSHPGQGAKAAAGYNDARPVITALKQYYDKHNEYPPTLRALVPNDLSESAWKTSEGKLLDEFFTYEKSGASYRLQFSYTGPGMNRCVYTPEAGKWECAGYY